MTTEKKSKLPSLRVPLPPPLSHDEIEFVARSASMHKHRLPDEVVVAIGMALRDAIDSHVQTHSVNNSVWGITGRLESVQRSER